MRRDASSLLGVDIADHVSIHELSELIGIGERQINSLAMRGILEKKDSGKFDTREAIRSYTAHVRKAGNPELDAEKIRLAREQADKIELQNARVREELVPAVEFEREWASVLRDVRAGMLAIPSRVQQRLVHLTAADVQAIDREVRDALIETANAE